jgi:ATP-dependent Clp protease ATP-binding subunit ClpB
MSSGLEFTDKAQETVSAAIQLAKDYAHAQVHPAHLAFALLNEGEAQTMPGGAAKPSGASLFSSAISRAGGDPTLVKRGLQKTYVRLCFV